MSERFDPMTGELITDAEEEVVEQTAAGNMDGRLSDSVSDDEDATVIYEPAMSGNKEPIGYDPMTGAPIYEEAPVEAKKEPIGYDPMTGAPIYEEAAVNTNREPIGYDPMTGEPIYEETAGNANREPIGYDPMTGEPIYENTALRVQTGFDPMTGEPVYATVPAKKKKSFGKNIGKILCGVAVAAVVIGVVAVNAAPRIILGRNAKFAVAAYKTMKDQGKLADVVFRMGKDLRGDKYSVETDLSVEQATIKAQFDCNRDKGAASAYGSAQWSGVGTDFHVYADSSEVVVQVPDIVDQTFVYDYTQTNRGYIAEMFLREAGVDINTFNEIFSKMLYSGKNGVSFGAGGTLSILKEEFNKLDFEKIDREEFEVDGKTRKCKGYEVKLDTDVYYDWIDAAQKITENYSGYYNQLMAMMGESNSINEAFNEMRREAGSIGRMYIRVYMYKGKIAAVELEDYSYNKVRLELLGGDYRTQNWRVVNAMTNVTELEQESTIKGKNEEFKWFARNERLGQIEYNKKSGDLDIQIGDYSNPELKYTGGLLKSKGKYVLRIDDIQSYNQRVDFRGTISYSKNAKIKKVNKGSKVFNVSSASEDAWELLIKEIYEGRLGSLIQNIL